MNDQQVQASNPDYCVWVAASAGTGKTKILTDRVLRLLIQGTPFNKILCLTFTNAAASEMQTRLNQRLAQWAISSRTQLEADLSLMLGAPPTESQLLRAQNLYNQLLSTQDALNINTIHSFCLKILKLFPLESSINPAFQILGNIQAREIVTKIKQQIYSDPQYEALINFFLTNFHQLVIDNIFEEIIQQKFKFKKLSAQKLILDQPAALISRSYCDLNAACSLIWQRFNLTKIAPDDLLGFFLTNNGDKRQHLFAKAITNQHPELLAELSSAQEQFYQRDQAYKLDKMLQYSSLLAELAAALIDKYQAYKQQHGWLDYDDLIYFTRSLLTKANAKDWILYKLDGGIDHILVDEAQDTSPEQWQIITALIEEFYSGVGSSLLNRTIFVVGDEKQSIFSFQGAEIEVFNLVNHQLQQRLLEAEKHLQVINLKISYRSVEQILTVVYDVFARIKQSSPQLFAADNIKILPFRTEHCGRVELWPLVQAARSVRLAWPLPHQHEQVILPEQQLAIKIASFIKNQITSKVILPSTGRPATFKDFMILVRTRHVSIEIIKQLKNQQLEVTGLDRLILNQNLSVLDLISAAKFTLAPTDDLNLASLLKSPIIGLTDDQLRQLIAATDLGQSIWQLLTAKELAGSVIITELWCSSARQTLTWLLNIYQSSQVSNFFHILVDYLNLREVLITANGHDSNEAINELLYLSSNYADEIAGSLQGFIYWFESNEVEIKRDVELANKIQIMTVHGSKGLQAPVVILCDVTSMPAGNDKFMWTQDGAIISSMTAAGYPQFFKDLKAKARTADLQEHLRLLYVAMTRASDHLVICGSGRQAALPNNCWYQLIRNSMLQIATINDQQILVYGRDEFEHADSCQASQPLLEPQSSPVDLGCAGLLNINYWQNQNLTKPKPKNYRTGSLSVSNHFEYGRVFHKILEDSLKSLNLSSLIRHPLIKTLSSRLQTKLLKSIKLLLANQEFVALSRQAIKTEVSIGMSQGEQVIIGRIDLLVIAPESLTIIDYKSDIRPPKSQKNIPASHIQQLNLYRRIIHKLYPDHQIICQILWLDNGCLMTVN